MSYYKNCLFLIFTVESLGFEEIMDDCADVASSSSPKRKKAKLDSDATVSSSQAEPANSCPICLDSWSSTGTHRLVSLKCGHLFGQLCIEKWLSTRFTCPQCNGTSKKSDIRPIYAKVICAVDNDERDDALRLLEVILNFACCTVNLPIYIRRCVNSGFTA